MKHLNEKVAVITGAGGGVGSALALQLADLHCHLALVDISAQSLEKLATALSQKGVKVSTHVVDIGDKEQMAGLPEQVLQHHGAVDLLINNAALVARSRLQVTQSKTGRKLLPSTGGAYCMAATIFSMH